MRGCLTDEEILAFVAGEPLAKSQPEAARTAVQQHLGDCSRCRVLVAQTMRAHRQERASTHPQRLPPIRPPGDRVGRYELVRLLGRGGAGLVYEAVDPKLHRRIALKLVRADVDASDADRLLREARAMAQLSHPNVVAVHDADSYEDGVFLAMELVDGCTLSTWLAERARPWREVVALFVAAGSGLVAAHAAKLVHRDFKPENVLVGRDGRPRVTDFGLARVTEMGEPDLVEVRHQAAVEPEGAMRSALLTMTAGTLAGTPAYMAPEQFRGARADEATDQFNFSAALYAALYGHGPFAAPGADQTLADLARAVLSGDIRAPSPDARVPRSVFAILARGLSREPRDRFASMTALLEALRETTAASAAPRESPRRSRVVIATAVAACAAVVGVWWSATARTPAPSQTVGRGTTYAATVATTPELPAAAEPAAATTAPAPPPSKVERPLGVRSKAGKPHRRARTSGSQESSGVALPPVPRPLGNGLLDPYAQRP